MLVWSLLAESVRFTGILRQQHDGSPTTHQECLDESEMILYDCVSKLLEKTGTDPSEVLTTQNRTCRMSL